MKIFKFLQKNSWLYLSMASFVLLIVYCWMYECDKVSFLIGLFFVVLFSYGARNYNEKNKYRNREKVYKTDK